MNFSRAAEELCLTQSAVSKQIHALEEQLNIVLFLRVPQGLVLTEAGRFYVDAIRPILEQLSIASGRLRDFSSSPNVLNLGIPATLAQKWLIPLFPSFLKENPEVKVNFTPRIRSVPVVDSRLDAEIQGGEIGHRSGLIEDYVIGREYIVVCAPSVRAHINPDDIDSVANQVLVEHVQVPTAWRDWFAAAEPGSKFAENPPVAASRYEQYSVMIPAIIAGMGLGIVPLFLAIDELRRGELVIPFKQSMLRRGYSLIYREEKRNLPVLQAFRTWLLSEASKTEDQYAEIPRG